MALSLAVPSMAVAGASCNTVPPATVRQAQVQDRQARKCSIAGRGFVGKELKFGDKTLSERRRIRPPPLRAFREQSDKIVEERAKTIKQSQKISEQSKADYSNGRLSSLGSDEDLASRIPSGQYATNCHRVSIRGMPRRKIKSSEKLPNGGDIKLQMMAETLENVYRKDLSVNLDNKSKYGKIIEDLQAQERDVRENRSTGVSSSSPVIPVIRKRRGRPPGSRSKSEAVSPLAEEKGSTPGEEREVVGTEERSLHTSAVVRKRPAGEGKYRLNLVSRIALKKRQLSKAVTSGEDTSNVGKAVLDIWSEDANKLIASHGASIDLGVVDWDDLKKVLLSAEEELELARLMLPTKTFEKIRKSLAVELGRDPLEEEWAVAAQVDLYTLRRNLQLGKAARNKLIQRNLRLVLFQAHKYHRGTSSLSLYDLCQEGVTGLIHGVDKYNPQRGHRFSTYAIYWVRNSILRALTRNGSSVRSPYNVAMVTFRREQHKLNIKRARLDLLVELERAPTDEEVMNRLGLTPERYRDILRSSARVASMNRPSTITGEELIHVIEDKSAGKSTRGIGSAVDDASLRFGVGDVLDSLKPKEGYVLRQRFGLDGRGEKTLGEIGHTLGLSREMVRKYEMCALMKMKHPTRMEYLRSYLS